MGLKAPTKLWGRAVATGFSQPAVLRLSDGAAGAAIQERDVLWLPSAEGDVDASRFAATASSEGYVGAGSAGFRHLAVEADLSYLRPGDIIRIDPARGRVNVLYRRSSAFNSMLLTERCNSYCLMCSQPPKPDDDSFLVEDWMQAIPLMAPETPEIGITGGEPTLLHNRLWALLKCLAQHLPSTAIHMLSNGRLFAYLRAAQSLAEVKHPDLMIGIPLYADVPWTHDFVVQAEGAFDQTIRGLLNLARYQQRVEIRVVIHAQTWQRLPELARFIARNLPFAEHVALMGLEPIGHVRMNQSALWIDPLDYRDQLAACVEELAAARMNVSIYNHQLCVLPEALWPYCRQSISDWKNVYLPECEGCSVRERCGGFFAWAQDLHSRGIAPLV